MLSIGVEYLDWDTARVVARLGDVIVEKKAKLSGCVLAICKDAEQQQLALHYEISRRAREADRDIAFKLHGPDFRQHCHFQSNFWRMMTEEEKSSVGIDI